MTLLLGILTFLLVIVSLFMVLVILAQKTKSDGGVGAGLGGGAAEAVFGAESGNVLTKSTQVCAVIFFVLTFALFLGHIHVHRTSKVDAGSGLPGASEFAPANVETPAPGASTTPPATPAPTPEAAAPVAPAPAAPVDPVPAQPTP